MTNGFRGYWSKKNLDFIEKMKGIQSQFDKSPIVDSTSRADVEGFLETAATVAPPKVKQFDWENIQRETSLTREEGFEYGYNLDEGYTIKLTPQTGGTGVVSFVDPEGWEITKDNIISPKGKVFDKDADIIIDSEGNSYTQAEWDTYVAKSKVLSVEQPKTGGKRLEVEPSSVSEVETHTQLTDEPPVLSDEQLGTLDTLLKIFTEEEIKGLDKLDQAEIKKMEQGIRALGQSPETEALLKGLLTDPNTGELPSEERIEYFFAPLHQLQLGSYILSEQAPAEINKFATDEPDLFRAAMLYEGRNETTEGWLTQSGWSEKDIDAYFQDTLAGKFVNGEWMPDALADYWQLYWGGVGDLIGGIGGTFDRLGADGIAKTLTAIGLEGKMISVDVEIGERGSPEWYAKNLTKMIPMLLAIVDVALLGGGGIGAIVQSAGGGAALTRIAMTIGAGISQSIAEGSLEAAAGYQEALDRGMSQEESNKVYDHIIRDNVGLLSVTNTAQFGLAFMIPHGRGIASFLVKALIFGFEAISEGVEEAAQLMITRRALGDPQQFDEEFWDNFQLGVVGGIAFSGIGSVYTAVQNKIQNKMTPEQKIKFNNDMAALRAQGKTEGEATSGALDTLARTPEGEKVIDDSILEVTEEEQASIGDEAFAVTYAATEVFDRGALPSQNAQDIIDKHSPMKFTAELAGEVGIPALATEDFDTSHGSMRITQMDANTVDLGQVSVGIRERREGHGTALVNEAIEYVKKKYPRAKEIRVLADGENTRAFWESIGFNLTETHKVKGQQAGVPNAPVVESNIYELRREIPSAPETLKSPAYNQPNTEPVNQPTNIENIVKRSAIIKELSEALNVPIRRGHFREKAAGIFKMKSQIIRLKVGSIVTVAHEVGHLLDVQWKLSNHISPEEMMLLLQEYPSPKVPLMEAFAEYLRYRIISPDRVMSMDAKSIKRIARGEVGFVPTRVAMTLAQLAPNTHAMFENFLLNHPDIAEILQIARDDYVRWEALPPTAKVMSQIAPTPKKPKLSWREKFNKLYTAAFDDLYPIREFVKTAQREGVDISAIGDPYVQSRLLRGLPVKMNLFLNYGTINPQYWKTDAEGKTSIEFSGKGLEEVLKPIGNNKDEFEAYIVARRVVEISQRGIQTGISRANALASIAELTLKFPEFEAIATELYAYQARILDYGRQSGLYSAATMEKMLLMNRNYVPFHRVMEGLERRGYMGKKMADIRSPLKKIKGSERDIISPLESIIKDTYLIIDAADRNMVGLTLARMAEEGGILQRQFEHIPAPMALVAKVNVQDLGIDIEGLDIDVANEMVNVFRTRFFNARESILSVSDNGKQIFYRVDPELYGAIMNIQREDVGSFIKMLSYPAKWLRAGAVLSPDFWLWKNPFRDTMTAYVYSRYKFLPIVDTIRGTFEVFRRGEKYQLFMASGAGRSMLTSMDRQYLQKTLEEVMAGRPKVDFLKHPLDALERLAEYTEIGTRMGEFMKGIGQGVSPPEAGFSAREVSLDFAVAGAQTHALRMMTAFWNANMRAADKFSRAAIYHAGKFALSTTLGLTIPSIILLLFNMKDERWKEMPRWEKDLYWIIFVGDRIYRVPKPFELGIIFASIPERVVEWMITNDPDSFKDVWKNLWNASTPSLLPTVAMPVVENMTNWSFFHERKLISEGLGDKSAELQYTQHTPEVIKKLGEWLNLSPIKINNLIRGYTAGLGSYVLDGIDAVFKELGLVPDIDEPTKGLEDAPIFRSFLARSPYGSRSQSVTNFYDRMEEYNEGENNLQHFLEKGWEKRYVKYMDDHPEYLFLFDYDTGKLYSQSAKYLRTVADELGKIRADLKVIYDHPDLTSDEKKEATDELNMLMTNTARLALELLDNPSPVDWKSSGFDMSTTITPVVSDAMLYSYMADLPAGLREYTWENKASIGADRILVNAPMVAEWKKADKALSDNYSIETKDKDDRFTDDYLYNNPEVDAALNFRGDLLTIHSLEAMELLKDRATAMGVPFETFDGISPEDEKIMVIQLGWRPELLERRDYADKDSPLYIEDEKLRGEKYDELDNRSADEFGNSAFRDARWRINIIELGATDETMIEDYVTHEQIAHKYSASSSEAIIDLIDHPELHTWGQDDETFGWSDYATEIIPAHRINVQWRDLDTEYKGYSDKDKPEFYISPDPDGSTTTRDAAKEKLLSDNLAYYQDRYRRDAYLMRLPEEFHDRFIAYNFLPESGYYRQRMRKEDPVFDAAVKTAMQRSSQKAWVDIDALTILPVEYDQIHEEWSTQFDAYDGAEGTEVQRAIVRRDIFDDPANEGFEAAWYRAAAYEKGFGGSSVSMDEAINYMKVQQEGKTQEAIADYNEVILALNELSASSPDTAVINRGMALLEDKLQANEKAMAEIDTKAKESLLSPRSYPDYIVMSQENTEMAIVLEMLRAPEKLRATGTEMVDKYSEYYMIPESSSESGQMFKGRERYLKDNMDLYALMYELNNWTEPIDFAIVPSEALEEVINRYDKLPQNSRERGRMRCSDYHEVRLALGEFDGWLVAARKLKPAYGTFRCKMSAPPVNATAHEEAVWSKEFIEGLKD